MRGDFGVFYGENLRDTYRTRASQVITEVCRNPITNGLGDLGVRDRWVAFGSGKCTEAYQHLKNAGLVFPPRLGLAKSH